MLSALLSLAIALGALFAGASAATHGIVGGGHPGAPSPQSVSGGGPELVPPPAPHSVSGGGPE